MVLELALMETVGSEADALAANDAIATTVKTDAKDGRVFMMPALLCSFGMAEFPQRIDQSYPGSFDAGEPWTVGRGC
jgi:hypothetical protein